MAFHTKTSEAYGNIRGKPIQPCNYLNRGHKYKVNICGQYNVNSYKRAIERKCCKACNKALGDILISALLFNSLDWKYIYRYM